ncbi:hypothetical protein SARC_17435, partial [Sphaeroforma arctica JP610]
MCRNMAIDLRLTLTDQRTTVTKAVVCNTSPNYDLIVGMGDLISLSITVTSLPTNRDPQKDQSDDDLLKPVYKPPRTVREMIPQFTKKLKNLIFENNKIKITDWAQFKFNNGYVGLDLTK